ncbi:MAG TPA: hypothetical protein VEW03_08270 [Longimicrobiaceae bacterium]|nr:hypothetical protein [Longimicrobiaceae bacterium]
MRPIRLAFLPLLTLAGPIAAQQPVGAYTPAPRYDTFHLGAQLTGSAGHGRDILFSWGRVRTLGTHGEWMPRLELAAGITTGTDLIDGLVAGPSVGTGYAFPGQYFSLGDGARAEPYLLAAMSTYGIGRFGNSMQPGDEGWGLSPALSAGFGVRVFSDEWDVDLATLEVLVEKRAGFGADGAQIYIRFGRAAAVGGRRATEPTPLPSPVTHLPPPPPQVTPDG